MDLIQEQLTARSDEIRALPPCVARYSSVFWEPLPGTGERIVALVAVEMHEASSEVLTAGTYCVLPQDRLRSMLGRQRGTAAFGILKQAAEYMTRRQQAGIPISKLDAPFHGFVVGPASVARGYNVEQLLDSAVRSVSAFGRADDLMDEEDSRVQPRHTVKTAEFLKTLKRTVAGDDESVKARFEKALQPNEDLPVLTVDYAWHQWMVQATSLPATPKQASHSQREAQSKLFEIEMLRRHMGGNKISPVLLVNSDVLTVTLSESAEVEAKSMLDRLKRLAHTNDLELIEASSVFEAADIVNALA